MLERPLLEDIVTLQSRIMANAESAHMHLESIENSDVLQTVWEGSVGIGPSWYIWSTDKVSIFRSKTNNYRLKSEQVSCNHTQQFFLNFKYTRS